VGIEDLSLYTAPAVFWDVFGEQGCPLRLTISDFGPILLSRLHKLNDIQTGLMQTAFRGLLGSLTGKTRREPGRAPSQPSLWATPARENADAVLRQSRASGHPNPGKECGLPRVHHRGQPNPYRPNQTPVDSGLRLMSAVNNRVDDRSMTTAV
jgi:hypothetical protein